MPYTRRKRTPEADEQTSFFLVVRQYALAYPELTMIFSIPNEGKSSPRMGALMNALGREKGIPDIFCAVPKSPYSGLFIEFKSAVGVQSKEQKEWARNLQKMGYKYELHRSWLSAWNGLVAYLNLPKKLNVK